jgi:hypothetical protein
MPLLVDCSLDRISNYYDITHLVYRVGTSPWSTRDCQGRIEDPERSYSNRRGFILWQNPYTWWFPIHVKTFGLSPVRYTICDGRWPAVLLTWPTCLHLQRLRYKYCPLVRLGQPATVPCIISVILSQIAMLSIFNGSNIDISWASVCPVPQLFYSWRIYFSCSGNGQAPRSTKLNSLYCGCFMNPTSNFSWIFLSHRIRADSLKIKFRQQALLPKTEKLALHSLATTLPQLPRS